MPTNQRYAGPISRYGTNLTPHESAEIDRRINEAIDEQEIKRRRLAVLDELDREEESHIARRVAVLSSIAMFCLLALFMGAAKAQTVTRQAVLTWTAPTTCAGGSALSNCQITGYIVQKLNGTAWSEVGTTAANVTTFTHSGIALGAHTYRVLANSGAGPSDPSAQASKILDVPGAPGSIVITVTVTVTP